MHQIKMDDEKLLSRDIKEIDDVYNECIHYLENIKKYNNEREKHAEDVLNHIINDPEPHYETVRLEEKEKNRGINIAETKETIYEELNNTKFKIVNETKSTESDISLPGEVKSVRLRKLSQQLPKIIITESNTSLNVNQDNKVKVTKEIILEKPKRNDQKKIPYNGYRKAPPLRNRTAYGDYPKRLVAKSGAENVALISNVPFEKIRLLNDTFHTMINLRWRWIVISTIVMHFTIWLVFAVFWYIAALAHYDFEPDPPKRTCVTGGKDFVTIFLASVEAQTTIGFGDRAIDEECPESIFLFIMQLILGTGLSGVLTCVVYAKLTRPEKLSKDGVGFSKKAVISMRDGQLCFMARVWDLNYDHIISSEITAHFVYTHNFEVTLSLKGASASMGTFTQSQTSYLPKEILWGRRFLPVVKYDPQKQTYVIDHKKLDATEPVETPCCSARELISSKLSTKSEPELRSGTPTSFSEKVTEFVLERSSSFRRKDTKS